MIRVGQKLQEERIKKGSSLEDVAKATKIRVSFLSAIEKGEYEKLPSSAYAQGFVRNYAEYLGLSTRTILALFRREFDEEKMYRVLPEGLTSSSDFSLQRLRIPQGVFIFFSVFLILLLYIVFQYRDAFISPSLQITSPLEKQIIASQTIVVKGETDSNVTVSVNGASVSVDQNGVFSKTIDVFEGNTIITITAVNKFGKETTVERHIEVKPSQ